MSSSVSVFRFRIKLSLEMLVSARKLICVSIKSKADFCLRAFSTSLCTHGRKSRIPFDKRYPINPKDVAPTKEGGSLELVKRIGSRSDMPRSPGWTDKEGKFHLVPEMIPEFIVPDLKDFKLKPYVSYKVTKVTQSELTAKDLFDACYAPPIIEDLKSGKTDIEAVEQEKTALLNKPS